MHVLRELEKQMGEAVADIIDADPGPVHNSAPIAASVASAAQLEDGSDETVVQPEERAVVSSAERGKNPSSGAARPQPTLTPLQLQLAENLNRLPGLRKERAWIHPARNSHAIIICRDVKIFKWQKIGEGVLRHWADHFVL
jgi:hypothetical protein